ncbi:helix-turn-helix domain-containing protein [Cytophagaceae bacterium DM2B3-1]|uniref:Helix-turn-helix domain-containing protein n=1 Tax=Xanthocytophaga flava TaxID=3048013 RepID=A0ABT7CDU2_9BACT|nr:helix-turn-helix domain-containing protein [Xanthocytophaga flavus]MDJ1473151.1 helix-turn-helix domain-containing protein [Xanthocytophaga flavus]MDJ1491828.1 helix-turn-helix domain-containing protein [Xanthocytophaga flavus]
MHTSYEEVICRLTRIETLLSELTADYTQAPDRTLENDRLGGIELAMEITGLAKSTIYTMASEGLIPFMKQRKKLYFSSRDLYQWIKDGKHKTLQEMEAEIQRHLSQKSSPLTTPNR